MTELRVVDNTQHHRFEVFVGPDLAGYAEYRPQDGSIAFPHTVVESRFQGQGVGSALAAGALDAIQAAGGSVLPYCSFVRNHIQRHPAYVNLVPAGRRIEFGLLPNLAPTAAEIVEQARAAEAASPTGRLPVPSYVDWTSFPFEGDLQIKAVADVELPEPARGGAGGIDCYACKRSDADCVWYDDDWRLSSLDEPSGLPAVLLLEPREHVDFGELPERLVNSLGRMMYRVERALVSLGNIERVQMMRIGDGAEHFHLWFLARPLGFTQGRGSFLGHWDDILPPRPVEEWTATLAAVRAALESDAVLSFPGSSGRV